MAFFGLTKLGSQSPFELAKETPLYVFEASDWQDAFMQTFQPGFTVHSESEEQVEAARRALETATLTYEQLPTMLRHLYKCPKGVENVPESARRLVLEGFASLRERAFALREFLGVAERVRRVAEQDEARQRESAYLKDGVRSREFVSALELRGALAKHARVAKSPPEKALAPLTDAQTLGWLKPTAVTTRRPTKSCDETKYASAMVKAGVNYY